MVVMTGRIGPIKYVRKPVGSDYGLEFGEFSVGTNKLSRRMYCMYITPKCSYCQVCSIIMHTKINNKKPEMMTLHGIFP